MKTGLEEATRFPKLQSSATYRTTPQHTSASATPCPPMTCCYLVCFGLVAVWSWSRGNKGRKWGREKKHREGDKLNLSYAVIKCRLFLFKYVNKTSARVCACACACMNLFKGMSHGVLTVDHTVMCDEPPGQLASNSPLSCSLFLYNIMPLATCTGLAIEQHNLLSRCMEKGRKTYYTQCGVQQSHGRTVSVLKEDYHRNNLMQYLEL